jgi:tetratricopeptide (TPR) repeat protein
MENPMESADPVTLLSVADLSLAKGDVARAARLYGALRERFYGDRFLGTFFRTRMGDTLLAEGKTGKARMIYEEEKSGSDGEGWAIASLALADLLLGTEEGTAGLTGAAEIYAEVSGKELFGSSVAYVELARTLSELEEHEKAITALSGFTARFPTSRLRARADDLKRIIAYRWLMALYDGGDWLGMAKLNTRHAYVIPFGRKAETFLKMGRAYVELGLYPDAAGQLNNAIRLGDDDLAEEAMALLAKVYYEQNDSVAVEKLMSTFVSRFPDSPRTREMKGMLLRVFMKNGEYAKASRGFGMLDDGPSLMLRARASLSSGDPAGARDLFLRASKGFNRKSDRPDLARAYLGAGDAEYAMGDYREAAGYYKKTLALLPDEDGPDRTWALYRITQSYSRLGLDTEKARTLGELAEAGSGEIPGWAETIFGGRGNL